MALPLALLTAMIILVAQPVHAAGDSQAAPYEVRQYQGDFGVTEATAEKNLDLQSKGAGIVEFLRQILKKSYAGVWFDNSQSTFVVPVAPGSDRQAVESGLDELGLRGAYRIRPVQYSWSQLEEAQETLITEVQRNKVAGQEVSALLDPRSNAVAVRYGSATSPQAKAEIEGIAAQGAVPIQVSKAERDHLAVGLMACTTTKPRTCDKPLRGGVEIGPLVPSNGSETVFYYGACTAGFKAVGNSFGNRYMLTAGHCFPNGADKYKWASSVTSGTIKEIGPVEEYAFGAGGDWGKIRANGSWWEEIPNWPSLVTHYWGNQTYPINYEAWPYLGEYLCFSGNKNGTSCGNVTNLSVAGLESEKGVELPPLVEVQGLCTEKGDSGGPLFSYSSNTAIGMLTGGYEAPTCASSVNFFTEIVRATADMGVTVGTRIGGSPSAITGPANSIGEVQATVTGEVNPNQVPTTYRFEYGPTGSYGSTVPIPDGDAGHSGPVSVNAVLNDIEPETTYHYRLVAASAAGESVGQDREFTTLGRPPTPVAVVDQEGVTHLYFNRGGQLQEWFSSGLSWRHRDWGNIGVVRGDPTAFQDSSGKIWVYYRGTNNQLQAWWFKGANWNLESYGYAGAMGGDPTALEDSDGWRRIYFRNSIGQLQEWKFKEAMWHEETYGYGGTMAGVPTAFQDSSGKIWVYLKNPVGQLQAWSVAGSGWTTESYGYNGAVGGDPTAVTGSGGVRNVYYISSVVHPYHWQFSGSGWTFEGIGGFNTSTTWTTWSSAYSLNFADVNGDGRADIVGRDSSGQVQVGISTGSKFEGPVHGTYWAPEYSVLFGDVNGDGFADVVGRNASVDVQVGLSSGDG